MWLKGHTYPELLMWCEVFLQRFSLLFKCAKDLKRSLPAGLGLSETQITSHGFDSPKEGVIEAGAFQGKSPYIFKNGWGGWWEYIKCYLY